MGQVITVCLSGGADRDAVTSIAVWPEVRRARASPPQRCAGPRTSSDGKDDDAGVELNTQVAVGKEVQNSRTKPAFQAPQSSSQNALLIRFGQLSAGDRGRGPQWADGAVRSGSNSRAPAVQGAARQRLGRGGRGAMASRRVSLLGTLASLPAANLKVRSQGSVFLSKDGVSSMGCAVAFTGKTQKIALQARDSSLASSP